MFSILSSYLLHPLPQGTSKALYFSVETQQALTEMHMMLLEILYHSKEIYVCLYCIMPLAAYSLQFPEIAVLCSEQIVHVIRKILAPVGGLEESCLVYIGHWVASLIKIGVITGEMQ